MNCSSARITDWSIRLRYFVVEEKELSLFDLKPGRQELEGVI